MSMSNCRGYNRPYIHNYDIIRYGGKGSIACVVDDITFSKKEPSDLYSRDNSTKLIFYYNRIALVSSRGIEVQTFNRYGNASGYDRATGPTAHVTAEFELCDIGDEAQKGLRITYHTKHYRIKDDHLDWGSEILEKRTQEVIFWKYGHIFDVELFENKKVFEFGEPECMSKITEMFSMLKDSPDPDDKMLYLNSIDHIPKIGHELERYLTKTKEYGFLTCSVHEFGNSFTIYSTVKNFEHRRKLVEKDIINNEMCCDQK